MAFGQCRRAIGRTWVLSPKNIRWIYIMIIRPILTYGCHVWWKKAQGVKVRNKMNRLQRMVCLAITEAMNSTPLSRSMNNLPIPQ
jgi:hypothetical protein